MKIKKMKMRDVGYREDLNEVKKSETVNSYKNVIKFIIKCC